MRREIGSKALPDGFKVLDGAISAKLLEEIRLFSRVRPGVVCDGCGCYWCGEAHPTVIEVEHLRSMLGIEMYFLSTTLRRDVEAFLLTWRTESVATSSKLSILTSTYLIAFGKDQVRKWVLLWLMSAKSWSTWQIHQPWPFARSVCLAFRCGRRRRGSGERFDGTGEEADMSPTRPFIDERNGEEELSHFQLACFNLLV